MKKKELKFQNPISLKQILTKIKRNLISNEVRVKIEVRRRRKKTRRKRIKKIKRKRKKRRRTRKTRKIRKIKRKGALRS